MSGDLKEGSSRLFWGLGDQFQGVAVVGLGNSDKGFNALEKILEDRETVRRSAAVGCKTLESAGAQEISVEDLCHAESAAEGAVLSLFRYQDFRSKPKPIPELKFYNASNDNHNQLEWLQGRLKAEGQNLARRLAEAPANKLTPCTFGENVLELFKDPVEVLVHKKDWIVGKGMGGLLSVAAGSAEEPRFIEITYRNGPKDLAPIVLVGKGVTFDSGGISIKPAAKMDEMRADMGGAAVIIGALFSILQLKLPVNIKCLIPLTENMVSGNATKPGDVITAMNGKTIAVDNTDAEGRLILADALCYSAELNPRCVIDIATLTGAIGVALGKAAAGAYCNNDQLFQQIEKAGSLTGDRVWRMPLWNMFTKQVTDYTAYDLNNVGKGQGGGSCVAAAFLREFVPKNVDWMHLDIASVMMPSDCVPFLTGMTGRPTRTLVEFIKSFPIS